jgi:GH25 family lysozyme M1 (1,4-beta-N-acetylmuramidase)
MKIIDVSTFQGVIDWERVKKTDVAGVMIRAGYGQNNIDAQFVRNISECNRLGIPAGIYWFSYAYNAQMARNEAFAALKAVQPYKLELPIAFDWEYDSRSYMLRHGVTPTPDLINSIVKAFCSTIENDGYYAMNYSNPDILNSLMTDVAAYDLWLAHWNGTPATTSPSRPCGMWQYGGTYVDGIGGGIDTSEAYRDYPALIRSVGLNHLADEPEPTEGDLAEAWAVERGIVEADYDPGEPMTKQSVIEMLYRLHGKENE